MSKTKPVTLARLTLGIGIHLMFPVNAILAAVVGADIVFRGPVPSLATVVDYALAINGILVGLTLATASLFGTAESIARRRDAGRRALGVDADPRNSEESVDASLEHLAALSSRPDGWSLAEQVKRLRAARWDHDSPEVRRIARDLGDAVEQISPMCDLPDLASRRDGIAMMTIAAGQIADALEREGDRNDADRERAARTAARYLDMRYGASDEFPD